MSRSALALLVVLSSGAAAALTPTRALAVGANTPQAVKSDVRDIFEDEAFRYCHDESMALTPLDHEYCELVGTHSDVCPALPKVCANEFDLAQLEGAPSGRLRFGREGKDYGPPPKEDGSKEYPDYRDEGRADGNGSGSGRDGSGSGDGNGKSGSGSGDGSGNGSGSGKSGSGDSKSGKEDGAREDGARDAKKDPKAAKDPPKPKEPPPEPQTITVPGWLSMLAQLFFYLVIALIIGGIGYYIYKNFVKGKEDDDDGPEEAPKETEELAEVPRGPIETDVDRLLARARAMSQAGKYEEAIEAAYAALLRRLEGDGLLDLHPSRTNGDYVRSLHWRTDLRDALRDIARDVESVQFGDAQPSPTLFQSIYARVLPLVGRTAAILLLLLGASTTSSCDRLPREAPTGGDTLAVGAKHAGGTSPAGLSAVVQLLDRNDKSVTVRRPRPADEPPPAETTVVLLPGTPVDDATWKTLRRWVEVDGGTLILAGYRNVLARDGVNFAYTTANSPVRRAPDASIYFAGTLQLSLPHLGALTVPPPKVDPNRPYYAQPQPVQAFLTRADGAVYAAVIDPDQRGGKIYAFADDRLFSNLALTIGDNAAFLVELFRAQPSAEVEIWDEPQGSRVGGGQGDGTIQPGSEPSQQDGGGGGGSENPLDSLAKAHLLPIILQLLALVILYLLYRGTRFGKPREPKEASRRAYADHARALGMTYARADASRHATSLFSIWALDQLRDKYLSSGRKGLTPLAESIAARTGRPLSEVMTVLMEATGARDEIAPPSSYRGHEMHAAGAPAPPQRKFWVMEELDRYLQAVKGSIKRGRQSR